LFLLFFGSIGQIKSSFGNYFHLRLAAFEKNFKLGFSRFLGFVIVGSQQMSAVCCDVSEGEDAPFVQRVPLAASNPRLCYFTNIASHHELCTPFPVWNSIFSL